MKTYMFAMLLASGAVLTTHVTGFLMRLKSPDR